MNILKLQYACIALVFLSSQISVFAQNENPLDYIVLNNGDTLYANVSYRDEDGFSQEFYKKIRLTTVDGKRKKYHRRTVSAFSVNSVNYESFWLNQSTQKIMLVNPKYDIDPENGEQHFLKVMSKGKLSHYELEWVDQENSFLLSMALLKREKDSYFIRADQGVLGLKRKALRNYFDNCPKLIERIDLKQLNEVWQVVDFYNSHCFYEIINAYSNDFIQ